VPAFFIMTHGDTYRSFGLVLGGGGVRCLAHLGLASVLADHGLKPERISCSSTGSLVGVLLAAGLQPHEIYLELNRPGRRLRWLRFSFRHGGLFSQKAMLELLDHFKVPARLEELPIPVDVLVTDLVKGEPRIYSSGDTRRVVMASAALPAIYPPVELDGSLMADGGITNNVPADICRQRLGSHAFVLSSSLEMNPETPPELLRKMPQVVYRSIYLPLIRRRTECVLSHSDMVIEPFSDQPLCFSRWREIVRFWSVATMADLYQIGRTHMERRLGQLQAQLKLMARSMQEEEQ
jgi:NTE family protein